MTTDYDQPEGLEDELVQWQPARRAPTAPSGLANLAVLLSAAAVGALAIGAVAIGALAIGRLAIGRMRVRELEIDNLIVRRSKGR